MPTRICSELRLVNGSTGDPVLFADTPGRGDALLFDAGDNAALSTARLGDLAAVFITHHHIDHFIGLDRIVRANLDRDKTLSLIGPVGTIRKVTDRVTGYDHPFFPFQKLTLRVTDVEPGRTRTAELACERKFAESPAVETAWDGPVVYDDEDRTVEAAFADHTVPCLSFALVEKPGYYPDARRIAAGPLRPGAWVDDVRRLTRAGAADDTAVVIAGGTFRLGALRKEFFARSAGARVAYVTDTQPSAAARPGLVWLCRGAARLYCDSFYAAGQLTSARKHRHMTAAEAAELARDAHVEELVLIHFATRYAGRYDALTEEARAIFPSVRAEIPPPAEPVE